MRAFLGEEIDCDVYLLYGMGKPCISLFFENRTKPYSFSIDRIKWAIEKGILNGLNIPQRRADLYKKYLSQAEKLVILL